MLGTKYLVKDEKLNLGLSNLTARGYLELYIGLYGGATVFALELFPYFLFVGNAAINAMGLVNNYSLEDYDNIVAVARNNEEVLYSSQYLNYVRTGYNYDVKAKQRQEEALKDLNNNNSKKLQYAASTVVNGERINIELNIGIVKMVMKLEQKLH